MDNLETIEDSALQRGIQLVPALSKVLITSRQHQLPRAWEVVLQGLEAPEALAFIREHAERLRLRLMKAASDDQLLPLVRVTGANPKALELALGHVKRGMSLDEVIDHLHAARKSVNDVFDDLFACAWKMMAREAQQILLVASFFVDSFSKAALGAASGLTEYHLDTAIEELVDLRLLDANGEQPTTSPRYSIHPLTRAFASARLREVPEFEEQGRERWSKYYLDFATRHLVRELPKERYWNALPSHGFKLIDPEWSNLRQVLEWADQQQQDQLLVELMVVLAHYMDGRLLNSTRIDYAQKAAQAAHALGQKEDEALFRIDGLGWTLLDEGQFTHAEQEITTGIRIAESLGGDHPATADLITLGNIVLARMFLEQEEVEKASAVMSQIECIKCKSVIQYRFYSLSGIIEQKKKNYPEAIRLYEEANLLCQEYGGEGEVSAHRLGLVYLDKGDLEQAEAEFYKVMLDSRQQAVPVDTKYAKYGLACIAKARGESEKARQLVQEILEGLSRVGPHHNLLNQVHALLQSLEPS